VSPTRKVIAIGLALVALAGAAACGQDTGAPVAPALDGGNADAGISCTAGFVPMDGVRCIPAVAADCAPGTAPFVGNEGCVPVGPAACAPGLSPSAAGVGCEDTPPAAACGPSERETASSAACAPIGDCAAPFPPSNATLFVDAAFSDAQLDATHFRQLGDAVKVAPADAVIAVAPGVYQESVAPAVPLRIVGKCAAMVELRSPAGGDQPGIYVARKAVSVSGVTLRGYPVAAAHAQQGGNLTLEDSIVVEARGSGVLVDAAKATLRRIKVDDTRVNAAGKQGWGVAAGAKSTVTLDDVTILRGTDGVFVSTLGTQVDIARSVIARQSPVGSNRASGVRVVVQGQVNVDSSVVRDVIGDGAIVADGGTGVVSNSVLRGSRVQGNLARGHGVIAFQGGALRVTGSSLIDHESVGAVCQNDKSTLELRDSVIVGPATSAQAPDEQLRVSSEKSGIGAVVTDKATLRMEGVVVLRAQGFGIQVDQTSATVPRVYVLDTQRIQTNTLSYGLGVLVNAGSLRAEQLSISKGSLAGISAGRGASIAASAVLVRDIAAGTPMDTGSGVALGEGGTIEIERLIVERTLGIGVLAVRGAGSVFRLKKSVVRDTLLSPKFSFGYGIAGGAGSTIELEDTVISGSPVVGLAGVGGAGRVAGGAFVRNRVAIHVQDGSTLQSADDDGDLGETELRVSSSTSFEGNETKVGSGAIPVPTSVLP
jgi:hypothetical protein